MKEKNVETLFGENLDYLSSWAKEWKQMPEFVQEDAMPIKQLIINFETKEDYYEFAKVVGQKLTYQTKSIWFPEAEKLSVKEKRYVTDLDLKNKYPLYIVSKGRSDTRLTAKALESMGLDYYIVVEEQEYEAYKAVCKGTVLVLDKKFQDEYDTFDELGYTKSKGPGAARNFAWEHSIANGFEKHWVMDDNITAFLRLNRNARITVKSKVFFRMMEDFCDRYSNIAIAGPNYDFFAKRKQKIPPYIMNTRIYSCNLITNNIPWRWRGRYNEDTDLSLRALKAGLCTVQFNAFLQGKVATQTIAGGNTAEFYAHEGTLAKSQMQVAMHPDVSELVEKFGRWHHHVDYTSFDKNRLQLIGEYEKEGNNDYGLYVKKEVV